jgi:hypothetical protein
MLRQELESGQSKFQNCVHGKELQEKVGGLRGQIQTFEKVKTIGQKIHSWIKHGNNLVIIYPKNFSM